MRSHLSLPKGSEAALVLLGQPVAHRGAFDEELMLVLVCCEIG